MSEGRRPINPIFEKESLELAEETIGPIVEAHLNSIPREQSPTADLNNQEYGFLPTGFDGDNTDMRPGREPLNIFNLLDNLGLDPDRPDFEETIRRIDGYAANDPKTANGWFSFLVEHADIDPMTAREMRNAHDGAYRVNSLTEDNNPAYVIATLGAITLMGQKYGVKTPTLEEWFRGIWIAEEDSHKNSMQYYGNITRILFSPQHQAARNSQLRAGTPIDTSSVIKMFIYASAQEFATNIAHSRTAALAGPIGHLIQSEIAKDEARHHKVYVEMLKSFYQNPDFTEETIFLLHQNYIKNFKMPGQAIPKFMKRSLAIAKSNIYGPPQQYLALRTVLMKIGLLDKDREPDIISDKARIALQELRTEFKEDAKGIWKPKNAPSFILDLTLSKPDLRILRTGYLKQIVPGTI